MCNSEQQLRILIVVLGVPLLMVAAVGIILRIRHEFLQRRALMVDIRRRKRVINASVDDSL